MSLEHDGADPGVCELVVGGLYLVGPMSEAAGMITVPSVVASPFGTGYQYY